MKREMSLRELQKYQQSFDNKYFGKYWEQIKNTEGKIQALKDMTIALTGEIGEFANIIKKINREKNSLGEEPKEEMIKKLKEELTDCLIYVVILSNILEMDLQKEYLAKTQKNSLRFQKYLK